MKITHGIVRFQMYNATLIDYRLTRMTQLAMSASELEFLRVTNNHLDFERKLIKLGMTGPILQNYTQHVSKAWFLLGKSHLMEAKAILATGCSRASFSRAYYAAYNASKGVRYIASGSVSLKGDDHGKASVDLPNDFTDVAHWSAIISVLYEHRLRADYDNWIDTATQDTLTPAKAVDNAELFIDAARAYLNNKYGMML